MIAFLSCSVAIIDYPPVRTLNVNNADDTAGGPD